MPEPFVLNTGASIPAVGIGFVRVSLLPIQSDLELLDVGWDALGKVIL